jgi:hypothetical protein
MDAEGKNIRKSSDLIFPLLLTYCFPLENHSLIEKEYPDVHCKNRYTDKKENQIFLIYKEIQSGAVAKSYMTNGFLIYGEIFAHFLIH